MASITHAHSVTFDLPECEELLRKEMRRNASKKKNNEKKRKSNPQIKKTFKKEKKPSRSHPALQASYLLCNLFVLTDCVLPFLCVVALVQPVIQIIVLLTTKTRSLDNRSGTCSIDFPPNSSHLDRHVRDFSLYLWTKRVRIS